MSQRPTVTLRWTVLVAAAVALLALGAGATYVAVRSREPSPRPDGESRLPATASPRAPVAAAGASRTADTVVTLSPEAVTRAGITVAAVVTGNAADRLRLPGVVEPNAYRQVAVTPLTAGRITRVLVEPGQHVRQGQTLAQVFSPEVAEAQTRYVSTRAELDAHERELQRTQTLVEIGAASRQELESLHAEHAKKTAEVRSARARLELLGMSAAALDGATMGKTDNSIDVPAPLSGVVTERLANAGQNVDPSTKLFTVVDLSTVWVVADLFEQDFSRVRVGSAATITTSAEAAFVRQGRVAYIDPTLAPLTRTARVRIELPNGRNELRLGMFVDVAIDGAGPATVILIPRSAVQHVGDREVVYLANPTEPGTFIERAVQLGRVSGDAVAVLSGLQPGDAIVTVGSFFVRAELERLGLGNRSPVAPPPSPLSSAPTSEPRTVRVTVGDQGFEPARLTVQAGGLIRMIFLRTSTKTCATEVVFPSLKITRALPLNEAIVVEFTPSKGEVAFMCGMNMVRGSVVVE